MPHTVFYFTDTAGFGGAEQALLILLAGLDRSRWQPVLIHHPQPNIAPLLEGARQLNMPLWPVPPMPDGMTGAQRAWRFSRELRRRKPAVFHAHLTWQEACKWGLVAAMLARVPAIVATVQAFVELPRNHWVYFQQRLLSLGVGCYIPVSQVTAQDLRKMFDMPVHKQQVIHNAITPTAFNAHSDPDLRARLLGNHAGPLILVPARLEKQKGHTYLLQAATAVPDAKFILAGDGSERAQLEAQVQTLGLASRVIFLGYRQDIPQLLACCDLVVLPSIFEGLPLVILEAMAASKPVIATRVGGTPEVVRDGETGLLVPPADPAALAQAICALLANPTRAQQLAAAGCALVQQEFLAETLVKRTTHVYEELLMRRGIQ